jgi:hypothetical protein
MFISEIKDDEGLYNGKTFEVKSHISFIEKKILCEQIIDSCLVADENNMVSCDFFMKYLLTNMKIVALFTDLEFGEESVQEYDFLNENELMDYILNRIDDCEISFINEMINKEIEQRIRMGNSIESIIASRLDKLIDKVPDQKSIKKILNDIPKSVNKIKPENLEIIKGILNKQGDGVGK